MLDAARLHSTCLHLHYTQTNGVWFGGLIHFSTLKEDSYRSQEAAWEAPAHKGIKKKKKHYSLQMKKNCAKAVHLKQRASI